MVAVWLSTRKGHGRNKRKKHYLLCWQVPELDANGLPLRYPSGRVKMKLYKESCHVTDRETAEAMRAKKQRQLNGLETLPDPVKHVTLDELANLDEGWLRNRERADGTVYLSRLALRHLRDVLEHAGRPIYADTIAPQDIETFIEKRREGIKEKNLYPVGVKTVNDNLVTLQATFGRAAKHGVFEANPFSQIERMQETPKEITPLTRDEERKLVRACRSNLELATYVRLALDSGCRAGELSNLRVVEVDLSNGLARVVCNAAWHSKTRRNRTIAFTPATARMLRKWLGGRKGKEYVFREADDKPRAHYHHIVKLFADAVDHSGIKRHVVLHDLRKTVGTLLAERGVNQKVAAEYLGHASSATTERYYQRVRDETLRAVVVKLRPTGTNGK